MDLIFRVVSEGSSYCFRGEMPSYNLVNVQAQLSSNCRLWDRQIFVDSSFIKFWCGLENVGPPVFKIFSSYMGIRDKHFNTYK